MAIYSPRKHVALFDFANHHYPDWLELVKENIRPEPWGKDLKILELYLRANFEIAKQQCKVYENEQEGIALWRAGYLLTSVMDPVWLFYEKNDPKYKQKWNFRGIKIGKKPIDGVSDVEYSVLYNPPEFNSEWEIYIDPRNFDHILSKNRDRLIDVFGEKEATNSHRLFRTIYGELKLEQKEAAGVIAQWYEGGYNFLMPLYFNSPEKVDLTAALICDETNKRYQLKTLLFPHYAYSYARAIVRSRAQFAASSMWDEATLDAAEFSDVDDID